MADLKSRWLSLIARYSTGAPDTTIADLSASLAQSEAPIDSVSETIEINSVDVPTKELPIYEATSARINYWHASGASVFLQTLLREYDLDFCYNPAAYNRFKIGYDRQKHRATFAVDDTHYYSIAFDTYDASPLSYDDARFVLERICRLVET